MNDAVRLEARTPEVLLCSGSNQNGGTRAHFLAALAFAQRAPCAAAILVRPAAEMVLFFRLDFPAAQVDFPECCEGYAVQFILKSCAFLPELTDYRLQQSFGHEVFVSPSTQTARLPGLIISTLTPLRSRTPRNPQRFWRRWRHWFGPRWTNKKRNYIISRMPSDTTAEGRQRGALLIRRFSDRGNSAARRTHHRISESREHHQRFAEAGAHGATAHQRTGIMTWIYATGFRTTPRVVHPQFGICTKQTSDLRPQLR